MPADADVATAACQRMTSRHVEDLRILSDLVFCMEFRESHDCGVRGPRQGKC